MTLSEFGWVWRTPLLQFAGGRAQGKQASKRGGLEPCTVQLPMSNSI